MTYLELVNEVLIRLREAEVTTVAQNDYSILIGAFVNESKRQVEDAWNWDALNTTVTVPTVAGTTNYVVTGSGRRQKNVTVNNATTGRQSQLASVPRQFIIDKQQLDNTTSGIPAYYAWNGTDGTDSKVELYPTPDGIYSIKFNMCVPQVKLTADATELTIQNEAVIAGAYARALVERGEDGGLSSSEAYGIYRSILSDQIAIESVRENMYDCWEAV